MAKLHAILLFDARSIWELIKRGKTIKGVSSSIRDQVNSTGHSASVEDFCILDNVSN